MRSLAKLLAAIVAVAWLGSCSETPVEPPPPPPPQLLVSDPVSSASTAALSGSVFPSGTALDDSVVFVSLPPTAVPAGTRAGIRLVGGVNAFTTAMENGGFDPVFVPAHVGDSVEVRITDASAHTVTTLGLPVRVGRRPIVVRTEPPRRKRDVPLNAPIVVVLSEPVDPGSLDATSVRLFSGGSVVAGTVRRLLTSVTSVVFEPAAPFSANTDYRLEVTQAVRDLSGEPLDSAVTVEFTTGTSSTGTAGSIGLSPDSIGGLFVGASYDIAVTVRDAAGNLLTGAPVAWTTSDPAVATVAAADSGVISRGRVRAVSPGSATITATSGALTGTALVTVSPYPEITIAAVTITPDSTTVPALDTARFWLKLWDADGHQITHVPLPAPRWVVSLTSSDSSVLKPPATLATDVCAIFEGGGKPPSGQLCLLGFLVQPRAHGTARLIATIEGVSDTALITAGPPRPVAEVRLVPAAWTLQRSDSQSLRVALLDANGMPISSANGGLRQLTWTMDTTIVTLQQNRCDVWPLPVDWGAPRPLTSCALATARDTGVTSIAVTSEGASDTMVLSVLPELTFTSITAGRFVGQWSGFSLDDHTCGTTVAGPTVCWGGDGGSSGDSWTHFSTVPWMSAGGQTLQAITAGEEYTCGLTLQGDALCWWWDPALDPSYDYWYLGATDGGWAVPGGHHFVALAAAESVCGLTTTGAIYCWAPWVPSLSDPALVSSSNAFTSLSVGESHLCALTADGSAYCAGDNTSGQLGDGSTTPSDSLVAVAGGLHFSFITAGRAHTCGLVTDGNVYCWGSNANGALGDGGTSARSTPGPISGGLSFASLASGSGAPSTCAITTAGVAYCWGDNEWGQIGDGTQAHRNTPSRVAGGLTFASLSTGDRHTCGVTTTGVAYCWGWNGAGQLGNGTVSDSAVPVKVAEQP